MPPTPTSPGVALERAGERRQLTVLFCDLVGSTELSTRLDAEDYGEAIRAYHMAATRVITRFGGHVAQLLGDGLLVYFGYPHAHEESAEQAVRAALDIVGAVSGLGRGLLVRVGLHSGPCVVSEVGAGSRHEMLALGETPNAAARVQAAASPGAVLMSAATHRLVAGRFVVEAAGPHTLKGLAEPMMLYRVVQPSGVRSRFDVAGGRFTPFVGREVELATLFERWERTQDGAGQNVVVLGEAGVGKSRLVYQLRDRLASVPHTWLECGATPYTAGTPFQPVIALLAQGLAFAPEDTAAEKLAKIERGLGELSTAETVALLADLLALAPPTPLQLSPELQRRKTIELLAQWTLALGGLQPLVILVEDLHWCDPSSLDLLGHLAAQTPTEPILILVTARPEFTPPWPARENMTTLQLPRLTDRQTRAMVNALTGEALPVETFDALIARADGVPLYVEELTKTLVEPGTARSIEAIPATLADSLMARLDRLSTAKDVAQRAAVLGREFAYQLLAAVAGLEEAAVRHGLARLVEAEIVFARGEPPEATYTFKHTLVQEAAYESLLKRTRQQLHARTAQALEELFPARAASEPEVIARHYDQAGLVAPAITHYQRAGERAAQRSANEEAISHLRRALALVATLPETRDRDQRELQLQMAIAMPLGASKGWSNPECEASYARARELASRIGESPELPRVLVGLATAYYVKGDLATGAEIAQEAPAAAERTGDPLDLLLAHVVVGFPFFYRGNFSRALKHYGQATELYDPREHASFAHTLGWDRGVNAHAYVSWCHLYLGHHDQALALSEKAVTLAKRVEHPLSLANVLLHAAILHIERREPDRALELSGEIVGLAEPLGFPMFVGAGKFIRGCARADSGESEEGIAEMQQALVELAQIGTGIGAPGFLTLFADRLRKVGRFDEALGVVGLGLARAEGQDAHWVDAELHHLHAQILLDKGDAEEEAEARLGQSLEIAGQQENKLFELRAAMGLARLWQRQGKRDQARALLAPVYDWFTEGFDLRDLTEAKALLDDLP